MKRDLKLVSEKTFSKSDKADHDLRCWHFGDLRLVIEVLSSRSVALMYFKKNASAEELRDALPGPLKHLFQDRPVHAVVVTLNWFERQLGFSIKKKAERKLNEMKKFILKEDKKMADNKLIAQEIIGEGAV